MVSLVQPVRAGGTKPKAAVVQGDVVMVRRVVSGNTELSVYELRRMSGHMSSEDSLAWLKSMTPGREIAWVDRACKGLLLRVELPSRSDTLMASVYRDTSEVWSFGARVVDSANVCHLKWNLQSSSKTKVGPGVYHLALVTRGIWKEFFVVVSESL